VWWQRFEIVVFSDQLSSYVDPIVERLDNKGSVHHRLYRDATQYVHGEHVRDLSKLNRPLTHTLYLTSNHKVRACCDEASCELARGTTRAHHCCFSVAWS
jgi:import inner membrane translocase subunit TIM50